MVFAKPPKITRPQLTYQEQPFSISYLDLQWLIDEDLDSSDCPCCTMEDQESQLILMCVGFRGVFIVLNICELDSAVFP